MPAALKNDLFLRALLRQPVPRTPMWIMRQAGRYLPEYRATRAQAGDFMSLCANPELACEVTLQPLRRYRLDAAILFSDILTVPDAMGMGLYFETGEGPKFRNPIRTEAQIKQLAVPDIGTELKYVTDAVSLIRRELDGHIQDLFDSGQDDHGCVPQNWILPKPPRDLDPIWPRRAGKHDVQQDQVRLLLAGDEEGLPAIPGGHHPETLLGQIFLKHDAHIGFVVYNENSFSHGYRVSCMEC